MSYQALARKWRPKTFAEVIGQEHVVAALTNGLDNQRIHHAFLFAGTRGVGKTTLARILARALNCEQGIRSTPCGQCVSCTGVDRGNFIDLIEVDAASRTKVDDTRELLDNVQYTPTQGRFKIYLIDEVHMLSTHSFNALLKTLEEPPEHVKFLLATTDPQKLPTTILSRCIQFNLKAMDISLLTAQLEKILDAESVGYDQGALLVLARSANGSVRDALSLLDQGIAFGNGEVRVEPMRAMLGMIDDHFTARLLDQVCRGQGPEALETVGEMALRSVDFSAALDEILTALHNISLYQVSPRAVEGKGVDSSALSALAQLADAELLQLIYQIALIGKRDLPLAPDPRSGFEMVLLRMIAFRPDSAAAQPARQTPSARPKDKKPPPAAKTEAQSAPAKPKPQPQSKPQSKPQPPPAVAEAGTAEDGFTPAGEARRQTPEATDNATAGANITLDQLDQSERWAAFIEQSGLGGLARELMMHMVPESVAGHTLSLTLDAGHRQLLNDRRLKKIETHLAEQLSQPVKLQVNTAETGATARETPSRQQDRARQEKQQAATQAFLDDPKVRELVDLFDAEVVDDTIRPPS